MGERDRGLGSRGWHRVRVWSQASTNRKILAAAVTVGVATFAVSMLAVLKELVVAYNFGTTREVDAFLVAWLLPALLLNVLAESFGAALVPTYIAVRERDGPIAARQLLGSATLWAVGVLLAASVGLGTMSSIVLRFLGATFDPQTLMLTTRLFLLLLPVLVLNGLATVWSAALNAGERFASVALAPVTVPLAAMAFVLVFGHTWGIASLAVGTLLGYVLKCAWVGVALQRHGLWVRPAWSGMTPELRQVVGQYFPVVGASLLMGSTLVVDQAMAARLQTGSVAALAYGSKVVAFALGLGSLSLGTAVLPHFANMVSREQWAELRHTVKIYTGLILMVATPAAFVVFVLSEPMVRLLFQRGEFTAADTGVVSQVQALFAIQIPFFLVGTLYVRLVSALRRNHILLWGTVISVLLNIGLNLIFMRWIGVPGIALSTSVVYFVAAVYLGANVFWLIRDQAQ